MFENVYFKYEEVSMNGRIKLTPEQLRSIANIFREKSNYVNDMLQFLNTRVDNIESLWDGAAQGSYFIQFLELQVPLNKFPQALDGMARTLDNVAQTFEDADRLLASEMGDTGIHAVSGSFPPESGNLRSQRAAIQRSAALSNQIGQTNAVWNLLGTRSNMEDSRLREMARARMGRQMLGAHNRAFTDLRDVPQQISDDIDIPPQDTIVDILRRWWPVIYLGYWRETLDQGVPADNFIWDILTRIPILNGDATRAARISTRINLLSCICHGYDSDGHLLIDTDINPSGEHTRGRVIDGHICEDNGSQANAARHAVWVAAMTRNHGRNFAQLGGDAHETNPDIIRNHPEYIRPGQPGYPNYSDLQFDSLYDADMAADLLNNRIGMQIGSREGSGEVHDIMYEVLDEFYRGEGLWVVRPNFEDGEIVSYNIERQNLSMHHFNDVIQRLDELDSEGRPRSAPEPRSTGPQYDASQRPWMPSDSLPHPYSTEIQNSTETRNEETGSISGFSGSPGKQ